LRKKKTLELIKSLDGSFYKHFVTRDLQSSTSSATTSMLINPSRQSIVDVHAMALLIDQSSLLWGGLRRADYVDVDMESDRAIHFKETGFNTSLDVAAKDLAEELEMSPDDMVA